MSSLRTEPSRVGGLARHVSRLRLSFGAGVVVAFLILFFVWPLGKVLVLSVTDDGGHLSLAPLFALLGNHGVQLVLLHTVVTSLAVSFVTLIIAYPAASCMARLTGWKATVSYMIILFPFLTSSLVRTFVFIVLLGRTGALNQFLTWLHVPGAPWRLLFNETGVIIGMSYVLLPYMLLSLVGSMKRLDRSLPAAARSLGASPITVFATITFPLTLPGVAAGVVITTILGFGYFVTPALMGGPAQAMIAQLVEQQIVVMFNVNQAAGLSVIMLVVVMGTYLIAARFLGLSRLVRAA